MRFFPIYGIDSYCLNFCNFFNTITSIFYFIYIYNNHYYNMLLNYILYHYYF